MPVITRALRGSEMPLALEEGGIHILRSVRGEIHHGHQRRQVNEQLPMRHDGLAQSAPAFFAALAPDFGLLHAKSHEQSQQRRKSAQEKQRTPAPALKQEEITDGGKQVAGGITLLQQTGQQSAQPRRNFLHRERCAHAPFTTHADPEQRAQHQERCVVGREPGEHFSHRIEHQIDHQRKPAAVAVREQAEQERAHGTKHQCRGDGERHGGVRFVELSADRGEAKCDQEEIESVQGPAKKSGRECSAVIGGLGYGGGLVQGRSIPAAKRESRRFALPA